MFPDQDVLNVLCENHVLYLDHSWNVMMNWKDAHSCRIETARKAPYYMYQDYINARKKVKIAHFAGFQKPWNVPDCDFAEFFWKYARNTQWYEILIKNISKQDFQSTHALATKVSDDPYQISIPGMKDTLYVDGVYVKLLNKLNKWFPMKSKRRKLMRKIGCIFFR